MESETGKRRPMEARKLAHEVLQFGTVNYRLADIKHLMTGSKGNSDFCVT